MRGVCKSNVRDVVYIGLKYSAILSEYVAESRNKEAAEKRSCEYKASLASIRERRLKARFIVLKDEQ